jgi:hypothetical protein
MGSSSAPLSTGPAPAPVTCTRDPEIEARIRKCEEIAAIDTAETEQVHRKLDALMEQIDSGDLDFSEEFEDPSVVRHIAELRERVRRESGVPPLPIAEAPTAPARIRAGTRPR